MPTPLRALGLLLVLLLLGSPLAGQQILTELRLDKKEPRPEELAYVRADGGIVTLSSMSRSAKRRFGLYKYDANLRRQWRVELLDVSKDERFEHMAVLDDEIYAFVSYYLKESNELVLKLYRYNLAGQPLENNGQVILRSYNERTHRTAFGFEQALDRKSVSVLAQLREQDDVNLSRYEKQNLIYTFVLIRAGKPLQTRTLELPHQNDSFEVTRLEMTSTNTLYVLGIGYETTDGGRVRNKEFNYTIYRYNGPGQELDSLSFAMDSDSIVDIDIKAGLSGELIVSGLFGKTRGNTEIYGTFHVLYAADATQPTSFSFKNFTDDVQAYLRRTRRANAQRALTNFYLNQVVPRSDGGALVLAEQYYVQQRFTGLYQSQFGSPYSTPIREFHYEEVVVVSFGPDGEVEWSTVVPKQQIGPDPDEFGYALFIGAEQVILVYRDFGDSKQENVFYVTVNQEGFMSAPQPVFTTLRRRSEFFPTKCAQISNREGIIAYYDGEEKQFVLARMGF